MTDRVLAVFAHPDDESLLAGGTLAALADAGVETVVVCATRGEDGLRTGDGSLETTGTTRERELAEACRTLGAAAECLGYPDGALEEVQEGLRADVADALRRLRPRAVVTFGPEGLYWHPDHIAVHEAVTAAAADGDAARALYFATMPDGLVPGLVAEMRGRQAAADLWGLDPAAFGVPESSIATVVDVRAQLPRKLAALRSHRSQLPEEHLLSALPDDVAERFLGREYFVRGDGAEAEDWLLTTIGGDRR